MNDKIKKVLFMFLLFFVSSGLVMADVAQNIQCSDIAELINECAKIYNIIKIALTVGLVVLTMLDFGKAVIGDAEEEMKKAQKHLITRIIIIAIIFLLPPLIEWIIQLVNVEGLDSSCIQNL